MGALGDVMDRWNTFPAPVKILVIGGVGVAGYLGYQHFVAGGAGAAGTSDTPTTLDLAPQGTTDNLSANGGANSGAGTGTTATGTGSGGTSTGTTSTTSTGTPTTGGGTATKTGKTGGSTAKKQHTVKKHTVKLPAVHKATAEHVAATAKAHEHPNIGWSAHANARPKDTQVKSGSGKRPTLQ